MHSHWLAKLVHDLPFLESLEVNIYLDSRSNRLCRNTVFEGSTILTNLKALTSLRVYYGVLDPPCLHWHEAEDSVFDVERTLVMEYSAATKGMVEVVKAKPDSRSHDAGKTLQVCRQTVQARS